MTKMYNKIFVLGLDGATFDLIIPWIKNGELPTFKKLMDSGSYGYLGSTIHPLTAPAWSSFMTGMNPGKHGVYDFVRRRIGSYKRDLVNASMRSGKTFWKILSERGKRVCVVNVPMTYPPEIVNGFLVSGIDTPDIHSNYTYPESLAEEISDRHLIAVDTSGKNHRKYLEDSLEAVERRFEIMDRLFIKEEFDFFMEVINETDAVQHCFWEFTGKDGPFSNAIFKIYEKIDNLLEKFLRIFPHDYTLMIMSDHGAGPIEKIFYLDTYLNKLGLLNYKNTDSSGLVKKLSKKYMKNLIYFSQRYLPSAIKGRLKRMKDLRSGLESFLEFSEIEWSNTKAYSIGNQGNICINLRGREPQGIIKPGKEYEELCKMIISGLEGLKDPDTNEKAVDKVYRREELYHGPNLELAPDLLIRWKDDLYLSKKEFSYSCEVLWGKYPKFGRYSSKYDMYQTGTHKLNGIAIFYGKNIQKGANLRGAEIIDLAPTVLYLMNEEIPRNMDGKVLTSVVDHNFLKMNPIKYRDDETGIKIKEDAVSLSKKEEERIRERLEGLGYIDE